MLRGCLGQTTGLLFPVSLPIPSWPVILQNSFGSLQLFSALKDLVWINCHVYLMGVLNNLEDLGCLDNYIFSKPGLVYNCSFRIGGWVWEWVCFGVFLVCLCFGSEQQLWEQLCVIWRLSCFISACCVHTTLQLYKMSTLHSGHTPPRGAGSSGLAGDEECGALGAAQLQTAVSIVQPGLPYLGHALPGRHRSPASPALVAVDKGTSVPRGSQ